VEDERGDFRRMGCRGRVDLLQALFDAGFDLRDVSFDTIRRAAYCAFENGEMGALELLLTPDVLSAYEASEFGEGNSATLLRIAIYWDSYARVRYLLENGVHALENDEEYAVLTREEQLLLAAEDALDREKEDAIRAFQDAGFGYLLDAARNEDNVRYVEQRARGNGEGPDLLGGLAGAALGASLGGGAGAALGLLAGTTSGSDSNDGDGNGTGAGGPLPLATNRVELGLRANAVRSPRRGLGVKEILPEGPGDLAGLAVGDVILSIAGEPVAGRGSLYVATEKAFGMQEFEVEYFRDGEVSTTVFDRVRPEVADAETEPVPAEDAAQVTGPMASGSGDVLSELERLGDLRDRGIISEDEFEMLKAGILEGS